MELGGMLGKVFILQLIFAVGIICVLKTVLDRMLIDSAIKKLDVWRPRPEQDREIHEVVVVTHKPLKLVDRRSLEKTLYRKLRRRPHIVPKIDKSILGGVVIQAGSLTIDHSLSGRLKEGGFFK